MPKKSAFPKTYVLPDGSIYKVTLENVRSDYADTVRQFDDLTEEQKTNQINAMDETQAEAWMADQWYGAEIVTWGTDTGRVDKKVRARGMEKLKRSADGEFACELEQKPKKTK